MFTGSRRLLVLLTFGLACTAVSGCPGPSPSDNRESTSETVIKGRAPLNASGIVRVTAHEGYHAGAVYEETIQGDGSFTVKARGASGKVTLEAIGGSYTEPANGAMVHHAGEKLRAVVLYAKQLEVNEVAITPWTEIAFARGGIDGYADSIRVLAEMLSCQSTSYTDLLQKPPALPTEGIQSLTPNALAYLYMGAFSQLADDLSTLHGVQAGGARLTSMRLAKVLAEDFEDGRIDGKNKSGNVVYLVGDQPLPPDILRQQFAQSLRHFLKAQKPQGDTKSWGNESTLGETAMLDFMRCICNSTDTALGPPGAPLDLTGPTLNIVTPTPGSHLAASQDVVCEARDPSGIVSMNTAFLDTNGNELIGARGNVASASSDQTTRRFVAPLHIDNLQTGAMQVRCDATDRWGNTTSRIEMFHINQGALAPVMTISAQNEGLLQGRFDITCDCRQDPYSTRCSLEVSDADATLEAGEPSEDNRKVTSAWDTRNVLDGPKSLTCASTTQGVPRPVVTTRQVRVKNHQDGEVRGAVYLDTLVRGMRVSAFRYEDGELGTPLGSGDLDDNGQFKFSLSTEYRGPVLFRADYSPDPSKLARFHNVPLDANMSCTNAVLTLLVESYEPGQSLSGLSLNVGSSMHEALTVALWQLGQNTNFSGAAKTAKALVSNYFSVGTGKALDPRTTWVADLTHAERVRDPEQEVMGLFHVGLSRLAAERSLQHCGGIVDRITVSEILDAMRRDIGDGKLDGMAFGSPVHLACGATLSEDFFRIDLARAIRNWIDKTAFVGTTDAKPVNNSGLTKESVTSRAPVVQGIAKHYSPLFGNRPGENFDGNGPQISYKFFGADQRELDLSKPVGTTTIRLVVRATHNAGIVAMSVTLNEELQTKHGFDTDVGAGEYIIQTSSLAKDGIQRIEIRAQDAQGNQESIQPISFKVDRLVPSVALDNDELWIRNGTTYGFAAKVAKSNTTAQMFVNDTAVGEPFEVAGKTIEKPLPLDCDATHKVAVKVWDLAGNSDSKQQVVHCDATPPTIRHLPSPFVQEQSRTLVDLSHHPVTLDAVPEISVDGAEPLQKVWTTLNSRDGDALPTLHFAIGDPGPVHTHTETLVKQQKVAYKYIFTGRDGQKIESDWRLVQCSQEGACSIPFSYQTMLPDSVLSLPLALKREQNFIARSNENEVHTVLFKVEDLAGNVSMAHWSFRLRLFTPQVDIDCNFHPSFVAVRLGNGATGSTLPGVAGGNFPALYMNMNTAISVDDGSLTPGNATHVFSVPETSIEWRIDKTLRICQRQQPHTRTNNDLVVSQRITPRDREMELRAGNEQIHNPMFTPGRLEFSIQQSTAFLAVGRYNNREYTKMDYSPAGPVDLCFIVKDLRAIRRVSRPTYLGSRTSSPPPIRIAAPTCENDITASWRDDNAPVLHVGPAPDISDTESYYH